MEGDIVQLVECLPRMHKTLGLVLQYYRLDVVSFSHNPSTKETEAAGLEVQGYPGYTVSPKLVCIYIYTDYTCKRRHPAILCRGERGRYEDGQAGKKGSQCSSPLSVNQVWKTRKRWTVSLGSAGRCSSSSHKLSEKRI